VKSCIDIQSVSLIVVFQNASPENRERSQDFVQHSGLSIMFFNNVLKLAQIHYVLGNVSFKSNALCYFCITFSHLDWAVFFFLLVCFVLFSGKCKGPFTPKVK